VAKSDKDEFNFDDFQYSGVKLTPVPDLTQEAAAAEPVVAEEANVPLEPVIVAGEGILPVEPEDKKGKKKANKEKPAKVKKEKPVKVKTVKPVADIEGERKPSAFLKQLSEASPYNVLLGVTVVILLLAVLFLFIEFRSYDFNLHPPTI